MKNKTYRDMTYSGLLALGVLTLGTVFFTQVLPLILPLIILSAGSFFIGVLKWKPKED